MPDIESALFRIREYAKAHGLTPEQVESCFLAGWFAAKSLRPEWTPAAQPKAA